MASSLVLSSSPPDPINRLGYLIDHYERKTTETDKEIVELSKNILGKISFEEPSSSLLLARVAVMICPKIKEKFTSFFSRKKSETETILDSLSETALQKTPNLIVELTSRFLRGELRTKDDTQLIEYVIEKSSLFSDPSGPIDAIIGNLTKETAYDAFVFLIKHQPNFLLMHLEFILTKLTTQTEENQLPSLDKTDFFDALDCASISTKAQIEARYPSIWEQFEIYQRDGQVWKCLARRSDPSGVGYEYTFEFRSEFINRGAFQEKRQQIFPALEIDNDTVEYFDQSLLHNLGYRTESEGNIITIPDRDALMHRYQDLKRTNIAYAELPELNIISSPGIASDADFVQAIITYDGLISNGGEFIHDQTAHIIPLLKSASLGSEKYKESKNKRISHFQSYLSKITFIKEEVRKRESAVFTPEKLETLRRNLPILETLLGALVDSISAESGLSFPLEHILDASPWIAYLKNRYNKDITLDNGDIIPKFEEEIIRELAQFLEKFSVPSSGD